MKSLIWLDILYGEVDKAPCGKLQQLWLVGCVHHLQCQRQTLEYELEIVCFLLCHDDLAGRGSSSSAGGLCGLEVQTLLLACVTTEVPFSAGESESNM